MCPSTGSKVLYNSKESEKYYWLTEQYCGAAQYKVTEYVRILCDRIGPPAEYLPPTFHCWSTSIVWRQSIVCQRPSSHSCSPKGKSPKNHWKSKVELNTNIHSPKISLTLDDSNLNQYNINCNLYICVFSSIYWKWPKIEISEQRPNVASSPPVASIMITNSQASKPRYFEITTPTYRLIELRGEVWSY